MKKYTLLSIAILTMFLVVSCRPKQEDKVKDFAVKFGDFVNTNQKDSIQKYYPDFGLTDSLTNVGVSNIIIEPFGKDGEFKIAYSPDISIIVQIENNGSIAVEKSKGLLAFSANQIGLLEKSGVWRDDLSDIEISNLFNEENEKRNSFTSSDLDFFNLHGPVKEMTISYGDSWDASDCFCGWGWGGSYNFNIAGEWTNYKQIFPNGLVRNNDGKIIELKQAGSSYIYKWKDNKVISFDDETIYHVSYKGTFLYNNNDILIGGKISGIIDSNKRDSNVKLYDFDFDQYGNWISCKWTTSFTVIDNYYSANQITSYQIPEKIKNFRASVSSPGIKDFYAMEDGDSDSGNKRTFTRSGKIIREIHYY